MNNNLKGAIVVALVVGIGYFAYKKIFSWENIVTKRLDADFGFDPKHKDGVKKMDKLYVKQWGMAIKRNAESFMYNGKEYWVKGGSATQRKK